MKHTKHKHCNFGYKTCWFFKISSRKYDQKTQRDLNSWSVVHKPVRSVLKSRSLGVVSELPYICLGILWHWNSQVFIVKDVIINFKNISDIARYDLYQEFFLIVYFNDFYLCSLYIAQVCVNSSHICIYLRSLLEISYFPFDIFVIILYTIEHVMSLHIKNYMRVSFVNISCSVMILRVQLKSRHFSVFLLNNHRLKSIA